MKRRGLVRAISLSAAGLGALPVSARTEIHPYLQVQQVFEADVDGTNHGDDTVTYTGVGAGFDMNIDERRLKGQIDYQYLHYLSWSSQHRDTNVHSGIGSVTYQASQDLSLHAEGIATRTRGGLGGGVPGLLFGDLDNTTQIFAAQVGPTWARRVGDLTAQADYRLGWTRSQNGYGLSRLSEDLPNVQDNFTTISQTADISLGSRPGGSGLPFGWRLSGGWQRDNLHVLGARYDDAFVRADATVPVARTVALLGGVGYERGKADQAQVLASSDGVPILDRDQHYQADPSKSRRLSYDEDGLIWDVGVLWKPDQRTSLELHGGHRYGGTIIFGNFSHQLSPSERLQVVAYDDLDSFGRQLTSGLNGLSPTFAQTNLPVSSPIAGCTFGANGGPGVCLPALYGVADDFYRSYGAYAMWSGERGRWTYGVALGYDHRRYLAPNQTVQVATLDGVTDQSVYVNGSIARRLSPVSTGNLSVFAAWYRTGEFTSSHSTSYGTIAAYNRNFTGHISGSAALGLSSCGGLGVNKDDVIGTALLAMRYQL